VIVPKVDAAALTAIAERVRANVESLPPARDAAPITISGAIFEGRNRVVVGSYAVAGSPRSRRSSAVRLRDRNRA